MQNIWKNYFVFTKRDRNAAFIFLIFVLMQTILPYLAPAKKLNIQIDKTLQKQFDSLRLQESVQNNRLGNYTALTDTSVHDTIKKSLFYFDPNTLDENGFIKLGLPPKVIHTLINYRNKGGYFKKPEDIRKIYGLSGADANRLIPYVRIESLSSNTKPKTEIKEEQHFVTAQTHQYKKININTATAEDWKAFHGIGDVIANRIIKFRASIGGFKSVEQVGKTYGLSDSIFQQIKPYLFLKDSVNN